MSFLLLVTPARLLKMSPVDLTIVVVYFIVVLAIGVYLKKYTSTSEEFFLAGRKMTAWIAGLSFISANLGSLETMGYAAATYQHGLVIAHAYYIGAIPAILVLAMVMLPFYYVSKTHSVPGYLRLRYGESTRTVSSITFAVMTILMSGINMFSMAKVMQVILGWNFNYSMWISSLTVAVYVMLGGLLSAIFNEVLQFFLIWLGSLLIPILGLIESGGWSALVVRINERFAGQDYTHLWRNMGSFADNPMGLDWIGVVLGWGLAISFGYWTTDFLVVQRVLAAKDLRSAQLGTILGAALKMMVPLIVILPGLLGLAILPMHLVSEPEAIRTGAHSYNEVLPLMMARYCGPGLLGLGVTALIAGFMSGMAGNVSAFATVWTYDIYRALIRRKAADEHYVKMGRWCSILGVFLSIGTAYLVMFFDNIIAYAQVIFIFGIVPQFVTIILGMLWKRTTPKGGFYGLLAGTMASIALFSWVRLDPAALKYVAFNVHASEMADNVYRAFWCLLATLLVTVGISLFTKPKPEAELTNLVYGFTPFPKESGLSFVQKPAFWAALVGAAFIIVNVVFW
ncbi:MAG TPA: sodium:solute symporter family protein [Terriglobia bacterium]|nr:sodium:solute symporter family protein [Terriglobia bacterium]